MKKNCFLIIVLLLYPFYLFSDHDFSGQTVSINVMPDIKPVAYINDNNEPDGLYVRLLQEMARIYNFKIVYHYYSWPEGLEKVKNGEIDLMPAVIKTAERDVFLDFHHSPVMTSWGQVFINANSDIESLLDLEQKKVAIMKKDQNAQNLKQLLEQFDVKCTFVETVKHSEIVPLLEEGTVDAGVFFNSYNLGKGNIKRSSIIFNPVNAYFATAEGKNAVLMHLIDEQLESWKRDKNSFYYSMIGNFFSTPAYEKQVIPNWLLLVVGAISMLLLTFILWSVSLRYAVKRKAEQLKFNEAKYRRLIESLEKEYLIYSHDPQGVFTYISPSVKNVLGFSQEDYLNHYTEYFTDNPINKKAIEHTEASIRGEKQEPYEIEVYHKNGSVKMLEVTEVPIFNSQDEVIAVEGIAHDISRRKMFEAENRFQEQKLIQSDKLMSLGELAAGMAHEINQPLTVISLGLSNLSFLCSENKDNREKIAVKIEKLLTNVTRIKSLIEHIRVFSRDQSKTIDSKIDLTEAVKNALSLIQVQYKNRDISIVQRFECDKPHIRGNIFKLEQVILNMLSNAKDALEEKEKSAGRDFKKEIVISTMCDEEEIVLEIEDNGSGISEENINKLFQPFFTTKAPLYGTGLGLSISYGIIKELKGDIRVDSKTGEFTRFTLSFQKEQND